jgi:EAL domain-containing protein (putative c-di-GMP-specific phosphodiesterase class I)
MNDKIIIAEGIENQEMLNHARKLTIKYAQGYLYSAPVSSEAIEKYITSFQTQENRSSVA